ncbi:MAG: class I SAM-dependent methyltransferase [Planctomycetota bacterium]
MAKRKVKKSQPTMAAKADKFSLYEQSVQTPEHEVEFFEQAYSEAYKKTPIVLREDFCGTFSICCHWVASNRRRIAFGVDLCEETLAWGREHNLAPLKPSEQKRVTLLADDVRTRDTPPADVLAAQNFSFWIFKTRAEVTSYFRTAYENLATQGILVTDMMGGGECYEEGHTDKRVIVKGKKGFSYHWTQDSFNPITADASFSISFHFPDGSKIKPAFEYDWRFWTIPEVREMLAEAGFRESHVYWERENEDDPELDGGWYRCGCADSDPSWICYIVAIK